MVRASLVLACMVVLVLAGCTTTSQASGSGVVMTVLNAAELSDIYVPLGTTGQPQNILGPIDIITENGERYIQIANLNVLVHNQGYSDSLAALYVTGYDPNLFLVEPTGPFERQDSQRFCYKDIILESQYDYSIYGLCAVRDDVLVGGGFSQQGDDQTIDLNLWNIRIDRFFDGITDRLAGRDTRFFEDFGRIIGGIHLDCQITRDGSEATASGRCSFTSSFIEFLNRRNTRGTLLLAFFGQDLADCRNGCVVVPSPRLPRNFIAGNSPDFPGGELYNVDYGIFLNVDRWPNNYNEHNQLFQISACYLYTTYATPIVCIDPTPLTSDGDVCRPGVQELSHGQPAPLKITSIEQINQGPRVMFTIHVENTLGGTAFNPGAVDFCAPGAPEVYARDLRDVAKVIDARILGQLETLDCRDGTIRLQNGKGQISCFYDLPLEAYQSGAFQTALNIEIGYLYRSAQTIPATIHRI